MLSTSHTARLFLCTYLPVHFTSALIYMAFINPHERITMPRELVDNSNDLILFNFTDSETTSLDRWVEVSDTVREAGRSKAALVSHVAYNYQSAIFFYLLNPLPDGACFAGVDIDLNFLNLSAYQGISIDLHRQGVNSGFKLLFYTDCADYSNCSSYESFFQTSGDRQYIQLPFHTFEAYFRGKHQPNAPPLDRSRLTRFGIQVYGGVYEKRRQSGPGSLELFTIAAYK
ncbi:unnamed protein product [Heterobilharzia americana]|nr:unnamed protein product [Heterobilharzia americana]